MTSLATLKAEYVVDTNSLIWYLTNTKKLSKAALAIFDAADREETRLLVSAITLAELFYANIKWKLFSDFETAYAELAAHPSFQFVDFSSADVLQFSENSSIPEMHDRMIVGLAKRIGAPLVTSDGTIRAANLVEVVW